MPPCLVDLCKNEGIHLFPKNETRKAQWIQSIVHIRRGLTVRKNSKICSAHFIPNDYVRTPMSVLYPNVAPRVLKKTAIPSIFPWTSAGQEPCEVSNPPSASITPAEPSMTPQNEYSLAINLPINYTYGHQPPTLFVKEQSFFNIIPSDSIKDPLDLTESNLGQHQTFQEFTADDNDIAEEFEIAQTENIIFQDGEVQEFDVASSQSIVFQDKPTAAVRKQIDKFAHTQESINNKHDKSIQTENTDIQKNAYGKSLMKKWNNMRDRLMKSNKRLKEMKSGSGAKNVRKCDFYDQRFFLKKTTDRLETDGNMPLTSIVEKSPKISHIAKKKKKQEDVSEVDQNMAQFIKTVTKEEESRAMAFFKSIALSVDKFSDEEMDDFQFEVIKLVRNTQKRRGNDVQQQWNQTHESLTPNIRNQDSLRQTSPAHHILSYNL